MGSFNPNLGGQLQYDTKCRFDYCDNVLPSTVTGFCNDCTGSRYQRSSINGIPFSFCWQHEMYVPLLLKLPRTAEGGIFEECNHCRGIRPLIPQLHVILGEGLSPITSEDLTGYVPAEVQPHELFPGGPVAIADIQWPAVSNRTLPEGKQGSVYAASRRQVSWSKKGWRSNIEASNLSILADAALAISVQGFDLAGLYSWRYKRHRSGGNCGKQGVVYGSNLHIPTWTSKGLRVRTLIEPPAEAEIALAEAEVEADFAPHAEVEADFAPPAEADHAVQEAEADHAVQEAEADHAVQ